MRRHFGFLLRIIAALMLVFMLWKGVFMIFNGALQRGCGTGDFLSVVVHGIPLDLSTTCYILSPVVVMMLLNIWWRVPRLRVIFGAYYLVAAVVCSIVLVADACLYSFWDYKIDATIFNYLSSPDAVTNSVELWYVAGGLAAAAAGAALMLLLLLKATPRAFNFPGRHRRVPATVLTAMLGGLMFVCIRGGVGRSTANVGMVYYSTNQFLNHSAVNPMFSLFSSLSKSRNFSRMGRYFSPQRCDSICSALMVSQRSVLTDTVLNTPRPNVLIIVCESFAGTFVGAMGNPNNITPEFDSLTKEGLFFTNFYANSYRTDRGMVSILSGYPAFPTVSVMKLPVANRNLPSIGEALAAQGYSNTFLYGGDINFTNMQSYLRSTGYHHVISDRDFTASQRLTHGWGVTDSITFNRLYDILSHSPAEQGKWQTTFLTLASHEPWKVPYNRIENDKKANAMAYLDHCLGKFISRMKLTPQWDNMLVIILPDHGIAYPQGLTEASPRRYHIPMLWLGGALRRPGVVDRICCQSDLAATLLGQMRIGHEEFEFSRDVLSSTYEYPTAMHAFDNGIAFIDSTGATVFDITSGRVLTDAPQPSPRRLNFAKALLQRSYDNLYKLEKER